jgi:uncharacterized damage-inducible protein DinB
MNYYTVMSDYNEWMNQKLYALCADLPDDERRLNRGAFFKSIHGTLNHILIGDLIWLGRFTQQPFTGKFGDELYRDFNQLRTERERVDLAIGIWAQNLTPAWLDRTLTYTSGIDRQTRTLPHWLLVTHIFNHQTHHRGQLTTLLSQMGQDPGVTDLLWMPQFID